MKTLIRDEFAAIINEIPDQEYDVDKIVAVFQKHMPQIAADYGYVIFKAQIYEPEARGQGIIMNPEIVVFDITQGEETENYLVHFTLGNGGYVDVTVGIQKGEEWTEDQKKNAFVLARTVYILFGRARAMGFLMEMIFKDMLTGVGNETQLRKYMTQALMEGRFGDYCVNFMNLKNMKLINNRYGEPGGNQIMRLFAQAMKELAGPTGCVARLGGDNFVIFIENTLQDKLLTTLEHFQVQFVLSNGKTMPVKLESRIGYYYLQNSDSVAEAIRKSDIALRLAKKSSNPDVIQFEEHMKTTMLQMKQLEDNIPNAIANEEFVVYYQPKADIHQKDNYQVCGAEALVRWVQDGNMISPGDFIPILERNGMVTHVDYYVLEHVCQDIKALESMGITPVKISSNFSRRHLKDADFAQKVEAIIKKYDVNPKYLEIEITESYEEEDLQALTLFEKRMHALGVDLSVDDFGSGFSSLKMVKNIVADTIKLDKSIIDGIGEEEADGIIVKHIIQMVKALGKEVIAEGVEQEKQAEFLRDNGCTKIQGYLFGRPMPKVEFMELLVR